MSWHSFQPPVPHSEPTPAVPTSHCTSWPAAPAQQPDEPQTLQPEPYTSRAQSIQAARAYLIHHQVVVTLVPVAVLHSGRNAGGFGQGQRKRLHQALLSPLHAPSGGPHGQLCPPISVGFSARLLAGFLPPTQQPHTHRMPRQLLLLLAPLQPHLLIRRALWRRRHALSR